MFGTVRDAETGRPVPHALVRVSWRAPAAVGPTSPVEVVATTDRDGAWRVCDVPPDAVALVQASARDVATDAMETPLAPLGVRRRDLALPAHAGGAPPRSIQRMRGGRPD